MLGVAILNPVPALLPTERLSAFESCSEEGGVAWLKTNKAALILLQKVQC